MTSVHFTEVATETGIRESNAQRTLLRMAAEHQAKKLSPGIYGPPSVLEVCEPPK